MPLFIDYIDKLYDLCLTFAKYGMKYGMTYWATDRTAMLVNRVGQEITQRSGSFTVMGSFHMQKKLSRFLLKRLQGIHSKEPFHLLAMGLE